MLKQLFLLGLLAISASAENAEVQEEKDVLVLTDENYKEVIEQHPLLLVEFYAPWCGHCKNLEPHYAEAATVLKNNDPPIRIAKVDATEQKKIGESYGVQGFPTLKLFKGSIEAETTVEYDGGRTKDEIVQWMIKKSGPSVSVIESQEELDQLKEAHEVVVVAYLDAVDGDERQIFEKIADANDKVMFVATSNADLISGKTTPAVTLFKTFDEGQNEHEGEFSIVDLYAFVKANSLPLIMTFSQEKASEIFGGDIDVHLLTFTDESKDYHKDLVAGLTPAATQNKGELLHILIPASEDRILDYFGFKEADLPAIMLVNMASGMKKFAFGTKGDDLIAQLKTTFADDVVAFEAEYFTGALKPTLKSADPVDDSDEAVKILTGKSFNERVIESKKDVLVEFYAPWCGHCKKLAPKYDELAEKFADVDSIMIAKMDATENEIDHPGVDIQGFPTIIFFPSNDKQNPVAYEGDREVQGFTDFLKKNAAKFELEGESHGVSHDEL